MTRAGGTVHDANHKWWALGTVLIGVLMATLDAGIVAVGLTIMAQFRTDVAMVQWTVLAYLLVITITLLPFGRLADMFGRKQIYVLGFAVFTFGSALCGMAGDTLQLILFRALQALGAAMLMANGMAMVSAVFPANERGKAMGIIGTTVATGTTIGPTAGGLLTQWLGWRWIFYVNIPIGVAGIALAMVVLRNERIAPVLAGRRPSFDTAGAVIAGIGLVALLLGLGGSERAGVMGVPAVALYGLAACALVAFVLVERRVPEPIIDLDLFRHKLFALGTLSSLLSFLGISANMFLMPFYLQLVLGYPPSEAGLLMTPSWVVLAVVAPLSGWLSDRIGARLLSSLGLAVISLALFSLSRLDVSSGYPDVLLRLVLLGLGQGLFQAPNNSSVFGAVPRERYGVAGGFLSMMRNMGTVMGTALATGFLLSGLDGAGTGVRLDALGGTLALNDRALVAGFMAGMERAYLVAAIIAATGIVASLSRGGSFGRSATTVSAPEPRPQLRT